MQDMVMKTLEIASWCRSMLQTRIDQQTAYVCKAFWNWCRKKRLVSMSSFLICAGKGKLRFVELCRNIFMKHIYNLINKYIFIYCSYDHKIIGNNQSSIYVYLNVIQNLN